MSNINIYELKEAPKWRTNEILRYVGVHNKENENDIDANTNTLINECISEAEAVLTYRCVWSRLPVGRFLDKIDLGFTMSSSEKLAKHLEGCDEFVVCAATIGIGIDRLITKYSKVSPAKAVIMQAIGAERIEAFLDEMEELLKSHISDENLTIKERYSPGYGDLTLGVQVDIFKYLSPETQIGLTLNDSLLMSPSKSVTALIGLIDPKGIKPEEMALDNCIDNSHDCINCNLKDTCAYRKIF